MTGRVSAAAIAALLRPGMRVYVQGGASEPCEFSVALAQAPDSCRGVTFFQFNVPGLNRTDFSSLGPEARQVAFFATRDLERAIVAGRATIMPNHIHDAFIFLTRRARFDLAIVAVSPPDGRGQCSFGVSGDMVPFVLDRAGLAIAAINPAIPHTPGAPSVALSRFDHVFEAEAKLLEIAPPALNAANLALGLHVAELIEDGDTLEMGVGATPSAVMAALSGKRDLGIHTGLMSDSILDLYQAGVVTGAAKNVDRGRIVSGVAVGSKRLYDALGAGLPVDLRPVSYTHDPAIIDRLDRFVAVNSVIEIDLFGQANAEIAGGRFISGTGGLLDFVRAARRAPHGRSILALVATAAGGKISRIVPALAQGTPACVPRAEADYVATEHGVAVLRDKTADERAEALIAVAAPAFRDALMAGWKAVRAGKVLPAL